MKKFLSIIFILLVPIFLIAQVVTEPSTSTEAVGSLYKFIMALSAKNWIYAAAIGITLFVFIIRRYVVPSIDKEYLPLISGFLGILIAVATNLTAGSPAPLIETILGGLFLGNAASGFWSMIAKKFIDLFHKDVNN